MNKSTKIAVIVGVALLIIISVLGTNLIKVRAEDELQGRVDTYHIEVSRDVTDGVQIISFDMELPEGVYPMFYAYEYDSSGVVNHYKAVMLFTIDTKTGIIKSAAEQNYKSTIKPNEGTGFSQDRKGTIDVESKTDYPSVSGAPVYLYTGSNADIYKDIKDEGILNGETMPISGVCIWDKSNHYNYESCVYDSSLVTPDVRSVILSYDRRAYIDENGILQQEDKGYYYDIKFLVPDAVLNSEFHTEVWADIPFRRNSHGAVEYRKVFIGTYLTSDLYEKNLPQMSGVNNKFEGDDTLVEDTGYYYRIKEYWSDTIGKYCPAETAALYGGITLYIRNARYIGGTVSVVSNYVYFGLNPSDVWKTDTGLYRPDIYEVDKNLNEKEPSDNTGDKKKPNSGNTDYVGGVVDVPPSNNGNGNNSGMIYIPSGEWNIATFSEWVKNGFGLLGDNGILVFIGNLFWWLPAEFFGLIAWAILVGVIIAVIKLVF